VYDDAKLLQQFWWDTPGFLPPYFLFFVLYMGSGSSSNFTYTAPNNYIFNKIKSDQSTADCLNAFLAELTMFLDYNNVKGVVKDRAISTALNMQYLIRSYTDVKTYRDSYTWANSLENYKDIDRFVSCCKLYANSLNKLFKSDVFVNTYYLDHTVNPDDTRFGSYMLGMYIRYLKKHTSTSELIQNIKVDLERASYDFLCRDNNINKHVVDIHIDEIIDVPSSVTSPVLTVEGRGIYNYHLNGSDKFQKVFDKNQQLLVDYYATKLNKQVAETHAENVINRILAGLYSIVKTQIEGFAYNLQFKHPNFIEPIINSNPNAIAVMHRLGGDFIEFVQENGIKTEEDIILHGNTFINLLDTPHSGPVMSENDINKNVWDVLKSKADTITNFKNSCDEYLAIFTQYLRESKSPMVTAEYTSYSYADNVIAVAVTYLISKLA
jgi:hypothetical protein